MSVLDNIHKEVTTMKEYVVIELCKDTEGKMTPSVYSYEDIPF